MRITTFAKILYITVLVSGVADAQIPRGTLGGGGGGGGGGSSFTQGWPVSRTDATHLLIGTNAYGLNIQGTICSNPAVASTLTVTGGTPTLSIYMSPSCVLTVGSSTGGNVTCDANCTVAAGTIPTYPADGSVPIAQWVVNAGPSLAGTGTAAVSPYSSTPLVAGTGVTLPVVNGVTTINATQGPSVYFSSVASSGPNNTTTETTIVGTLAAGGSQTIPAGTFTAGVVVKLEGQGTFSLPATATALTLKVKCGSTVIATATGTPPAGSSTGAFRLWVDMAETGSGASGNLIINGLAELTGSSTTATTLKLSNGAGTAFDFTASCLLDVTAAWASAQASQSITGTNVIAYVAGAGAVGATGPNGTAGINGTNGTNGAAGANGSGNNTFCQDATSSTTTYTCPTPTPTISSLTGLLVAFIPQVTNSGSSTLNVAGLGVKTLKAPDCVTNLAASALTGGSMYQFNYNGTVFCQVGAQGSNQTTLGVGMTYPFGIGWLAAQSGFTQSTNVVTCWNYANAVNQTPASIYAMQFGTDTGIHAAFGIYSVTGATGTLLFQSATYTGTITSNALFNVAWISPTALSRDTMYAVCMGADGSFAINGSSGSNYFAMINQGTSPMVYTTTPGSTGTTTITMPAAITSKASATSSVPLIALVQ